FRLELAQVRWLARVAKGDAAPQTDAWLHFYLRLGGLADARGRATEAARRRAPDAARNLDLWIAALARRPEAIPPHARFGIDSARRSLPRDLLDEIEGRAA